MHKTIILAMLLLTVTISWNRDAFAQEFPSDLMVVTTGVGLCLDVRNGVARDGTPIQSYPCNGTAAQAWSAGQHWLISLLEPRGFITTQNSAAIYTLSPPGFWVVNGEQLTNWSDCLGIPSAGSGSQLVQQSCRSSTTSWSASPIIGTLHGDLPSALTNIPRAFMDARPEMLVTVGKDGLLQRKDGTTFKSTAPQSLPSSASKCTIPFTGGSSWQAWNTTYYVVTLDGEIYMANACGKDPILPRESTPMTLDDPENQINHAALANATSVLAAGEIDVVAGKIVYIDNCSGHYTPTTYSLLFVINWLAEQGASRLPTHGLRLNQLRDMKKSDDGLEVASDIRAGTGNCWSYVPPAS